MCNYISKLPGARAKCNHVNNLVAINSIEETEFRDYYDLDGICIFHSTDYAWKREKGFASKLQELISSTKFTDFLEINLCSNSETGPLVFRDFVLKRGLRLNTCTSQCEIRFENCEFQAGWLQLDNSNFSKGLVIKNCRFEVLNLMYVHTNGLLLRNVDITMGDAMCTGLVCKGNFIIQNCRVAQCMQFDDAKFLDGTLIFHNHGNGFVFEDTICSGDIVFDFAEINGDATFRDVECRKFVFDQTQFSRKLPVLFEGIKIPEDGKLEFKGSPLTKIFDYAASFRLRDSDIQGTIIFEYANLHFLTGEQKSRFLAMQKDKKVEIGKGCIKYRYQTPEKDIKTTSANVQLFEDIAHTFTNYFNATTGVSLGLEIVEKTPELIRFFYFTDEDLSESELHTLFAITSDVFWNARNPSATTQIEGITPNNQASIDNLIDLVRVCLKLGARFDSDTLSEEDLAHVSKITSLDDSPAIDPKLIRGSTALVLKCVIENLTINIDRSLVVGGDNSGIVTFRPQFESK